MMCCKHGFDIALKLTFILARKCSKFLEDVSVTDDGRKLGREGREFLTLSELVPAIGLYEPRESVL